MKMGSFTCWFKGAETAILDRCVSGDVETTEKHVVDYAMVRITTTIWSRGRMFSNKCFWRIPLVYTAQQYMYIGSLLRRVRLVWTSLFKKSVTLGTSVFFLYIIDSPINFSFLAGIENVVYCPKEIDTCRIQSCWSYGQGCQECSWWQRTKGISD